MLREDASKTDVKQTVYPREKLLAPGVLVSFLRTAGPKVPQNVIYLKMAEERSAPGAQRQAALEDESTKTERAFENNKLSHLVPRVGFLSGRLFLPYRIPFRVSRPS